MTRLKPIALDSLTEAQKAIVTERPERAVSGPFTIWLRRPAMTEMATVMMRHLRRGGLALPDRLSELAILVVARAFTAQFAWHSHSRQALEAGIDPVAIEAIRTGRKPNFAKADEAMIYDYTSELVEQRTIGDATHQRALTMWGEDFLIDLVNLIGCYMMIGAHLAAFRVETLGGETPLS